jgi:hypothetical protein
LNWIAIKDTPPPEAVLEISAEGRATRRLSLPELVSSASCGQAAVVRLPLALEIAGRVLDTDGSPLHGVSVLLREPGEAERPRADGNLGPGGHILSETHADEFGGFRIRGLEERTYLIRACHPSRRCQERLMKPPFDPIEIRFDRSGLVRGRVLSAAGAPEPSANVEISPNLATFRQAEDALRVISLPVSTNAEGRFELVVQSPGQFELEAKALQGGGAAKREVRVTSLSSPIDLGDIRLSEGGTFRARINGCGDGTIYFIGPMEEDVLASMRQFRLGPDGVALIELPGGGEWLAGARCGGVEAYLKPPKLPRVEDLWDLEVVFEIDRDPPEEAP